MREPVPVAGAGAGAGAGGRACATGTVVGRRASGPAATGVLAGRPLTWASVRLMAAVVDRPVPALFRGVTRNV